MVKKYLSSMTIQGLLGAGVAGIIAPYCTSFFFSSVRAEIQFECNRVTESVEIARCDHRLSRVDRTEGFVNSILSALGLVGVGFGVEGRRRAKGPLGQNLDSNQDGTPDRLKSLEKSYTALQDRQKILLEELETVIAERSRIPRDEQLIVAASSHQVNETSTEWDF